MPNQTHCCKLMNEFLSDKRIPLHYDPIMREYFLPLKNSKAIQLIFYCPWCGSKLPKDLGEEFLDILEKEYGLEHNLDILENANLPKEFKSDKWWQKRKL